MVMLVADPAQAESIDGNQLYGFCTNPKLVRNTARCIGWRVNQWIWRCGESAGVNPRKSDHSARFYPPSAIATKTIEIVVDCGLPYHA